MEGMTHHEFKHYSPWHMLHAKHNAIQSPVQLCINKLFPRSFLQLDIAFGTKHTYSILTSD